MTAALVTAPPIQEIPIRPHNTAEGFNQVLSQERALHAAQRPQLGEALFKAVDHIEKRNAALQRDVATDDPAAARRLLVETMNCATETACFSRTVSQAGGSVKTLVQGQ